MGDKQVLQFPGEAERVSRLARQAIDLGFGLLSQRYTQSIDIEIRLQTRSKAAVDREYPHIIPALARHNPVTWDLYFSDQEAIDYYKSNPQFQAYNGPNLNPNKHPLTQILNDLKQQGHLSDLFGFKLGFYTLNDLPLPDDNYLDVFSPYYNSDPEVTDNDFMICRGELTEELIERGFEESAAALYAKIFNASVAVPILQDAFGAIKDETDLVVVCYLPSDHDTETPRAGVIYTPSEFADLKFEQVVSLGEEIRRRGPDLRSVE